MGWRRDERVVSGHECECGCGEYTLVAPQTDPRWGHIRGEPMRFLRGHGPGSQASPAADPIENPAGLCLCGCGQITPVATRNIHRLGHVKGQHVAYVPGHNPGGLRESGSLYFIGGDGTPVKVGWTVSIVRRLREFNVTSWVELEVYGTIQGTKALERKAHRRLAEHRVRGEWFQRAAALELLRHLRAEKDAPLQDEPYGPEPSSGALEPSVRGR